MTLTLDIRHVYQVPQRASRNTLWRILRMERSGVSGGELREQRPPKPVTQQVALLWQTRLSVEILQLQNIPFEN